MVQAEINDAGELFLILDEDYNQDAVVVYRLDNGAEVEFVGDKCVAITYPSFGAQLRGQDVTDVSLESYDFVNDAIYFNIDIGGQVVNGRIGLASLNDKV